MTVSAVVQLMLNLVFLCLYVLPAPQCGMVWLAVVLLVFTVVACLYALAVLHVDFGGGLPSDWRWRSVSFKRRISSFLSNPNLLGAFIALSLPVCYDWLWMGRRWWSRWAAVLCVAVLVYTLWLTASRASILSSSLSVVGVLLVVFDKNSLLE